MVLVFGEDPHDCAAVRILVEGLRPDLAGRVSVQQRRAPMTLVRGLDAARARSLARKVVMTARAEEAKRATRVRACVLHKDTDAVEPSSAALADEIRHAYAGCPGLVVPAVAAWEVEAWWYLFPDAVATTRATWRAPTQHVGRDTGLVVSPKESLKRDVRPAGGRRTAAFVTYAEADSEAIARAIVDGGHLRRPRGTSTSWEAFVAAVGAI